MALLQRSARELWSLFVDDGVVAGCIVGWVVLACVALQGNLAGAWSGAIMFAGLATIFVVSTGGRDL